VVVDFTRHSRACSYQSQGYRRGLASRKAGATLQPVNRLGQETSSVAGTASAWWCQSVGRIDGGAIGVGSRLEGKRVLVRILAVEAPQAAPKEPTAETRFKRVRRARRCARCLPSKTTRKCDVVEQLIAGFPDLRLLTAANGTLGRRATAPLYRK